MRKFVDGELIISTLQFLLGTLFFTWHVLHLSCKYVQLVFFPKKRYTFSTGSPSSPSKEQIGCTFSTGFANNHGLSKTILSGTVLILGVLVWISSIASPVLLFISIYNQQYYLATSMLIVHTWHGRKAQSQKTRLPLPDATGCIINFMLQLLIADIIKVSVSDTISTVASADALK